ncbi:MAG: ABC transporter permease [Propionibacteriaceae bacterium]|jgi:peptide/nickel transport system permease protein|nr:ABC transporter permease [Propionibacteriaceae bacterium]
MIRYLGARLAQAVGVLWATFTVTFVLLYVLPQDPIVTMLGARGDSSSLDPAQMAELRQVFGFDQPVPLQYLTRLAAALRGDFGLSVQTRQPVLHEIAQALPHTLALAGLALALALTAGVVIATAASYATRPWLRQVLFALPPLGVALPTFWVGLTLSQWFSFRWRLLPAFGTDGFRSLILPALTLAVPVSASLAQVLSQSLIATWRAPHIGLARSKGARRWHVLTHHVFRNSLGPALAVLGLTVGNVLAGSVVTETIFARPGLGRLVQLAVTEQDIPVVQGVAVFAAAVFVVVNLVVDLVQFVVTPQLARPGAARPVRP